MTERRELYLYTGFLLAIPAFGWTWWECAEQYGLILGGGLGWLPALVISLFIVFLWPFALMIMAYAVLADPIQSTFWMQTAELAVLELLWSALIVGTIVCGALWRLSEVVSERWGPVSRRRGLGIIILPAFLIVLLYSGYLAIGILEGW